MLCLRPATFFAASVLRAGGEHAGAVSALWAWGRRRIPGASMMPFTAGPTLARSKVISEAILISATAIKARREVKHYGPRRWESKATPYKM